MSYLNVPRLVFCGKFMTDTSTVNNDPEHFNTDTFRPNYWRTGQANGWWNPGGTGSWRFADVAVTAASYADGSQCRDGRVDPAIGAAIRGANDRVAAKLVDLDPEQQMISQVWGFAIRLGDEQSGFAAPMLPTGFTDLWMRVPNRFGDSAGAAAFQSTLSPVTWWSPTASRAITELQAAAGDGAALSVRFVVDGYDDDDSSPDFKFGRLSGCIGVAAPHEPRRFTASRRLGVAPGCALTVNGAQAVIDRGNLVIDLGNSLPAATPGGAMADIKDAFVALLPTDAAPVLLASIPYRDTGWYAATSGIVSVALDDAQHEKAARTPIGIVVDGAVALAEATDGIWMRADENVFRMDPGDTSSTTIHATRFGVPLAGQAISLALDDSMLQTQVVAGPIPGPPVAIPTSALSFPTTVTTDADGCAEVTLIASDPGNPRGYIDGQVYSVTYGPGPQAPARGTVRNTAFLLNAHVYSGLATPAEPTWIRDIEPIFTQYANLYPVMRPIVDMADYADVVRTRSLLRDTFDRPIDDPAYMPVTRDLSRAKQDMIRRWLPTTTYMSLDSVDDLQRALQRAVELEHATIPPYLCALYSIKPGANVEIAAILRSVVLEEMLHMTLVANLMSSLGGAADIGRPGFVPIYPGPLPGGLTAGLVVRLRRLSIAHIRDVFMAIERPRVVASTPRASDTPGMEPFTIGWFYEEIDCSLVELHDAGRITFGHPERQITRWSGPGTIEPIVDLASARAALAEVRHQGEGFGPRRPEDGDGEPAHYYRFAQIVGGRRLVVTDGGFDYSGDVIPFDADGVWPMVDDPDTALLDRHSQAGRLSAQFRDDYRALLLALHRAFNGEPDHLAAATGLMFTLEITARQLMAIPVDATGATAGPAF